MGRYRKSRGVSDRLDDLRYIIRQLDAIRAFRRNDPSKLAQTMELYGLRGLYDKIRPSIEEIIYLPNRLPGIKVLLQITGTLRSFFTIAVISIVLAMLMRTGLFPVINLVIYRLLLYVPLVVLLGFVVTDFILRRLIARYEKRHPNLHNEERENLRDAVNRVIARMQRDLRERQIPPDNYPLLLHFCDYQGLTVLKRVQPRSMLLFRKKYDTYLCEINLKRKKD